MRTSFLSPYGVRALPHYHAEHPYVLRLGDQEFRVPYPPVEFDNGMFGGNSTYYDNEFTVECPTGSGRQMTLYQVAEELTRLLASIFLHDKDGWRPVYRGIVKFQEDPYWRNYVLFHEYFHGDNEPGLGASH